MRLGLVMLGKNVPSTRFRFLAMVPGLESLGHQVHQWSSRPSVYDAYRWCGWRASQAIKQAVRWSQLARSSLIRPDCIYLERGVYHRPSMWMDQQFRKTTKRLVLDVDDAIFLEFPDKIPKLIAMSDHVVAATPTLVEYVQQYTDRVTLIPTSIDLSRYTTKGSRKSDHASSRPVIGWIGSGPNVRFIETCAEALRILAREEEFELLVVANNDEWLRKIDLNGVTVRFETWSPEREVPHLHQMDIGIMPLPAGQEWMKYKAATKLLQYLSVGIPGVASPIGVNADILAGDKAGFVATSTDEWIGALRKLLKDTQLRTEQGRYGRELVERTFSIEANLPRLNSVLVGA